MKLDETLDIKGTNFQIMINESGTIDIYEDNITDQQKEYNQKYDKNNDKPNYRIRRAKIETSPLGYTYMENFNGKGLVDTERIEISETPQLKDEIPLKDGVEELVLYKKGENEYFYTCPLEKKGSSSISIESLLDGVKKIKEKEKLDLSVNTLNHEYLVLENVNSGFFNNLPMEKIFMYNYNKHLFSILNMVDDDRFMDNWRVHFNQINTGTIDGNTAIDETQFESNLPDITKILFLKAVELRSKGKIDKSKELVDNINTLIKEGKVELSNVFSENKEEPFENYLPIFLKKYFKDTMVDLLKKSDEGMEILTENGIDVKTWKKESSMTPESVSDFALTTLFNMKEMSNRDLALYSVIHFNHNIEALNFFLYGNVQDTFEELLYKNFDSVSKEIHGNEVFKILQEELKLPSDSSSFDSKEKEILRKLFNDKKFSDEFKQKVGSVSDFSSFIEKTLKNNLNEAVEDTKRKYTSFKEKDTSEAAQLAYEALVCQDLAQSLMGQDFNFMELHGLVKQRNIDYVEYFKAPQKKDYKLALLKDTYEILNNPLTTSKERETAFTYLKYKIKEAEKKRKLKKITEEAKEKREEQEKKRKAKEIAEEVAKLAQQRKRFVSVYAVGSNKTKEDIYFKDNKGTKYYLYKVTDDGKVEHINTDDLKYDASVRMHYSKQDGTIKIDFKNGLSLIKDDNVYISTSDDISTVTGATKLEYETVEHKKSVFNEKTKHFEEKIEFVDIFTQKEIKKAEEEEISVAIYTNDDKETKQDFYLKDGLSLMEDDNIYISTSDDASTIKISNDGKVTGATKLEYETVEHKKFVPNYKTKQFEEKYELVNIFTKDKIKKAEEEEKDRRKPSTCLMPDSDDEIYSIDGRDDKRNDDDIPPVSSSLYRNKPTIPLSTQPVPSVSDNQENKLSFVPYNGKGLFSKNKNFYITYGGKSYALKIGTSSKKLTPIDQTYIDSDRIQDQKDFSDNDALFLKENKIKGKIIFIVEIDPNTKKENIHKEPQAIIINGCNVSTDILKKGIQDIKEKEVSTEVMSYPIECGRQTPEEQREQEGAGRIAKEAKRRQEEERVKKEKEEKKRIDGTYSDYSDDSYDSESDSESTATESRSRSLSSLSAFSDVNKGGEIDNSPINFKTQGATKDLQR